MVAVGPQGPPGVDGAAATDADVAGYLGDPASQTRVAGDALYASQAQGAAADAAQPAATLDADTAANVADPATQTGQALAAAYVAVVTDLVDDDATDNRATIQAALDEGGTVILPPTTGRYGVAGELSMTVAGTNLVAQGAPMRQLTDGMTLVNVQAPDCKIDGMDWTGAIGTPDISTMKDPYQGSISAGRWCAVNIFPTAHRLNIPWIKGRGGSSVVRITGWNADDTAATTPVEDVSVGTVIADAVEFGFVGRATKNLTVDTVKGTYGNVTGASRGSHLLYLSDEATVHHSQPKVGTVIAENGVGIAGGAAHSVQIKGVVGTGEVGTIQASNCPGVLSLMDNTDLTIDSVSTVGDTTGSGTADAAIVQDVVAGSQRTRIRKAVVRLAGDGRATRIVNGTDFTIDDLEIEVNHATTGASTQYDVEVRGTRTKIKHVSINNVSPTNSWRAVGAFGGSGHELNIGTLTGVQVGVDTRTTDTVVYCDPERITLHAVDAGPGKVMSANGAATIRTPLSEPLLFDRHMLAFDDFAVVGPYSSPVIVAAPSHQAYTVLGGNWLAVPGDQVAYDSTGAANAGIVLDAGSADVAVSVAFTSQVSEGVLFRATDASNYLGVQLRRATGSIDIIKRAAGANTTLLSTPVTTALGRRYRLRVEVYGADIAVYLNDVQVSSYTLTGGDETTYAAQTLHGLRANASPDARFDTFRVESLA